MVQPYVDSGRALPFGQLQIDLHVWGGVKPFAEFLDWWNLLEEAGLRPVMMEVDLVFMNFALVNRAEVVRVCP